MEKNNLEKNSLEQKLFSLFKYNMKSISPLDEGIQQAQKVRRTKHAFKLGDIKKADVKGTGFTTKKQTLTFLSDILDKKYTDFKTKDELLNYIKNKREKLELDLSHYGKKKPMTKKAKNYLKNVEGIENLFKKYDEKRKPNKYHITAEITRNITFDKTKKQYKYAQDSLFDSRVIEAKSEEEAKKIMIAEIELAFNQDEYSAAARYNVEAINFIDAVNESTLTTQHPSQMKMKYAEHIDYSFTNEEKKFLDKVPLNGGTCVIDNFVGMYGKELKITRDDFIKLHQEYYNNIFSLSSDLDEGLKISEMWKIEDGITPLFLEYVCKKYDISHYAYDINNECFMKYISQNRNHSSLIYYAINDHMYLVKDEHKKSLIERAKEEHSFNTSLLEGHEKINPFEDLEIIENIDFTDIDKYIEKSCVFMFSRTIHNINDIFYLFLSKYKLIPTVDKTHKTNILQFTHNNNGVIHIYAADPNEIQIITYKQVQYLCEKNKIEFKNQTYMQFIKQLKDTFFNAKMGRVKRTKEEREAILERFNNVCNICKCKINKGFEIDHIRPLANGGKEEESNLQPLCKACHRDKCSNEHENGDYIKIIDSESTFNNHIQTVMDSTLAQTHAFIEPIVKNVEEERNIFNIDINKCRKNILYYGVNDYCVFTVFDKVKKYKQRGIIKEGMYYVNSSNYIPLRGNGWYYHNMIKYCLDNGIITHDNIRYEIISSLYIPSNYYNEFINYCYKHIDNYDVICDKLNMMVDDMKDYKKLAINGMIGGFKPNLNKRANWSSLCITNNSSEAFTNYIKHDGAFIHAFNVDNKKYFHALKQGYKTNLETEAPIYSQILQQEQIELHKLMMIVEANNGTILDLNTDAVSCIFEGDKLPFELDGINIKGFYYDDKKMFPKYKIEDKGRLNSARMPNNIRTEHYVHDIKYQWNITPDIKDNNFEPLVDKILNSSQSWFITGPAGAGKSYLINMIKQRLKEVYVEEEEDEEDEHKIDSVDIMRLKQEKEKLNKNLDKLTTNKEDVNNKIEKCKVRLSNKKKSKAEKEATQEKFNKLEKELIILNNNLDDNNKQMEDINKRLDDQKGTEDKADKIKSYVSLAPTNLSALIINGTTIHKFACLIKSYDILKSMKFKWIFLDEVSMLTEKFYKFLLMIKKLKPDVKFIVSGDYNQLSPINDRISEKTNYSKSPALFELCDFNKLELTTCRRASDELFNLIKFDNIPNLTPNNFKASSDVSSINMHLAFTNNKRIEINNIMMKDKEKAYKENEKLKLKKLVWDDQSQDLILVPNTPIICKVNNKENNLINNERFIVTSIKGNMITIKNDRQTLTFDAVDDNTFARMFRVAYCSTCHSAQGLTINQPYMIHEFERYSQNMTYVALSRAVTLENIYIYI